MQSSRSSTPLKRGLWSATLHTIANLKLNAKWLAHSAFQADPIGFESRQLHQPMPSWWNQQTRYAQNVVTRVVAGASPAEGTKCVAEGEVDSPRAVTPL